MVEQKKTTEESGELKLPPGVRLLRTLEGHQAAVYSVAFDPVSHTLASGSEDKTVKLWNTTSGKLLRTLEGHQGTVWSVAFDPASHTLASGSEDKTVKLWNTTSGKLLRTLEGHQGTVWSVAFDPASHTLASGGGSNKTVKLWNTTSGKLLRTLEGHQNAVYSVAFDPVSHTLASGGIRNEPVKLWNTTSGKLLRTLEGHQGTVWSVAFDPASHTLASGSEDETVKLWNTTSGKLLRTLEGHTDIIQAIAFGAKGHLLASKAKDHIIKLWDTETWSTLADIPEPSPSGWVNPLAFDLSNPYIATIALNELQIHLWELDLDVFLDKTPGVRPATKTTHHTTAKVVLVGDTGVGKSGLAERLINKKFVKTDSTHARRALLLESRKIGRKPGPIMHCDTVIWDLAGQPAYRLVHQFSMLDAAVACVLFDARNETNPFEGAAYWSQVLKQARTNMQMPRLLVAARIDVGGLPASLERINAFAQEHGFTDVFQTSAKTGDGCAELLAAIKKAIPWDDLPVVSSSEVLADLREFIARLKHEKEPPIKAVQRYGKVPPLLSIAELQRLYTEETKQKISLEDFIAYLRRLEDSDEIDLLVFDSTGQAPRPEDNVLLDPTRVDAYASALLVAAKDEPDGPGHLLESRVREGNFKLEKSERLSTKKYEKHVLWYVMESLFERDLALREKIKGKNYVVFPAQCTSSMKFPGAAIFGVALGMTGPVRSIYATLIAQLAHYEAFSKREFFQDAAAYHSKTGMRALVRLHDAGDGSGEIEVSFDKSLQPKVRQGFLEFVEKHIKSRAVPGSLIRRHAYSCQECGQLFDDAVVKFRLKEGERNLICPYCAQHTPLINLLAAPTSASTRVADRMALTLRLDGNESQPHG